MNQPYYQQPPYYQPPAAPSTSGTATASLILSILGLIGILPIIGSIIGLFLGYSAKSEIDRSNGAIGGRGMAQWGIALGWIGIVILGTVFCLVITGAIAIPGIAICAEMGNSW
ncbi:MAG: DUF4190 domain-containing protein [Anaerolineae bacterium]|jgi:hypothetical protein|nr:DUF4190 domain-containing protein [Anaerolineae bacterium]